MKKIIMVLSLILMSLVFCGCGNSVPTKQQLMEDISSKKGYTINNLEINLSDSSIKNRYDVSYSFVATNEYAEFEGTGNALYNKYDQGWVLTSAVDHVASVKPLDYSVFVGDYYSGYHYESVEVTVYEISEQTITFSTDYGSYSWPFEEMTYDEDSDTLFITYSDGSIGSSFNGGTKLYISLEYIVSTDFAKFQCGGMLPCEPTTGLFGRDCGYYRGFLYDESFLKQMEEWESQGLYVVP